MFVLLVMCGGDMMMCFGDVCVLMFWRRVLAMFHFVFVGMFGDVFMHTTFGLEVVITTLNTYAAVLNSIRRFA